MDNYVNGCVDDMHENRRMPKKSGPPQNAGARRLREAAEAKELLNAPDLRRAMLKKRKGTKLSPAVVHKWWNKLPENLSADDLFWITDTLEIRGYWLIYGKGEKETRPEPATAEQTALLRLFHGAADDEKEIVRAWMKTQEKKRGVGGG